MPSLFLAALLLAAASTQAGAQTLTRGPYLQLGTPSGITVRWRTDLPTDSRVRYGASTDTLTAFGDDPSPTTEHSVALAGLTADSTYYYSVGTTGAVLAGGTTGHFFVTAPAPGTPRRTRVWVLGDSGTTPMGPSFAAQQQAVRDAYFAFTGGQHTHLWLMLGDIAYPVGSDAYYQAGLFDVYPEMLRKSVLWPSPGNHDYDGGAAAATQTGPYFAAFTLPRGGEAGGAPSGTEAYYSFDYANIHFISLDAQDSPRAPAGEMLAWLARDLAATNQTWIVAYWHQPPYSKGSHDSDAETELVDMRTNALPVLEEGGVDLVLGGHSHSYERSYLLRGHYGPSWTLAGGMILDAGDGRPSGSGAYVKPVSGPRRRHGTVALVAGSGGHTGGGSLNHPVMFRSLNTPGSVVLDFDGARLDAAFLDQSGTVQDSFTILKAGGSSAPEASRVRVYPNPYRPRNDRVEDGRPYHPSDPLSGITFDRLPDSAKIEVYSLSGRLVAEFAAEGAQERIRWDARGKDGRELPSGGYLAVIKSPGGPAVVRKVLIAR